MKMKIIPIVIGALSTVIRRLIKGLEFKSRPIAFHIAPMHLGKCMKPNWSTRKKTLNSHLFN